MTNRPTAVLMFWSFSTLGCPDLDLNAVVDLARRYALNGIELRTLSGSTDLPQMLGNHFGTPERAARHPQPVPCCSLDTSFRLTDDIGGPPDQLLPFVPWAEALGVPYLRIFDGGASADGLDDASLRTACETLAWWRDLKQTNGWRTDLMIETHGCLCTTPSVHKLQTALAEPAALLWDTHHTWRQGGEAPLRTWTDIGQWVKHIHFKDSVRSASTDPAFTYVLPGRGEMPLQSLFQQLQKDKFAGPLSLEWEKQWHPELPPLQDALDACRSAGLW